LHSFTKNHKTKFREADAGAVGSPVLIVALPLSGLPPSPRPSSAHQTFPSVDFSKIHYVKKKKELSQKV
jgi:hypothetical protein